MNRLISEIVKNQKNYLNKYVDRNYRERYKTIINLGKYIKSKAIEDISLIDSAFGADNFQNFNIVDGFHFAYSNLYGIIWRDSTFYTYTYSLGGKYTLSPPQKLSQLEIYEREIVTSFCNWDTSVFSHQGPYIGGPSDGTYYLASKVRHTPKRTIQTIAFYYE